MDNHQKTDYISWTIITGLLLLVVEITFFNKGLVFSLIFAGILLYFGGKRLYSSNGKLIFGLGCLVLFFTTIDMMVFKFLIVAVAAYVIIYFYQARNRPLLRVPVVQERESTSTNGTFVKPQHMFKNLFYGRQRTPEEIYEWEDINIQTGIGDTKIDISNTVLPKGEAIISIRNLVGNIQILVPYDVEVSVAHSVLIGTSTIFETSDERLVNQTLAYRTENYQQALQKVKIITSMGVGRLEVKRI